MTFETDDIELSVEAPCLTCGHDEAAHEERDAEEAGNTLRRTYCTSCADWHPFVPDPREL
jgi:hypothetical protein